MTAAVEAFALLAGDFPPPIADRAVALARCIAETHPELHAAVRPGWKSLNFRHERAGYVCGVFLLGDKALLVFEHGRLLSDPEGLLEGDARQIRQIPFPPGREIPREIIAHYVSEAIALRS